MCSQPVMYNQQLLPGWETRLRQAVLVIARLGMAYLFFTQLWWKLPPRFGCPADFGFTIAKADTGSRLELQRTSGLCDWLGIERVYSTRPRPLLVAQLEGQAVPHIFLDIHPVARINGLFVESVVMPGIRVWGWVIFLTEAMIVVTLLLGLFSRLGALLAVVMSTQLLVGLAGIPNPPEWEWSYILMVLLSLMLLGFAPGRVLGVDAWLRPRLAEASARGSRLAATIAHLT
jgi:uncharacterized membrane protein YphA (DoxX/SURF4 family)